MGKEYIYISTGHTGFYEKYGYEFFKTEKDVLGEDSRVYRKRIFADEAEKNKLCEAGGRRKAKIVKRARKNTEAISYCGFSCNHCFLGEWCGGCRSVFSCCSFGTLHEKGKCPNIVCCEGKGIGGCYECGELDDCEKGIYQNGSDGKAAKAQALFIRKYGKERFLHAHDKLNEVYDFKKAQELLGTDVETGLKKLYEEIQNSELDDLWN